MHCQGKENINKYFLTFYYIVSLCNEKHTSQCFYLWSKPTEVGYDGWDWHDVDEEWSQQILRKVSSNDGPEKYLI